MPPRAGVIHEWGSLEAVNAIYNPVSLALLAGAFVLFGAAFGAWLGAALANEGARHRVAAREATENAAARLLLFGALRVVQLDVHFVHNLGAYSETWTPMWLRHLASLEKALSRQISARALDATLFSRFVECLIRVEILHGFLQGDVGRELDTDNRANAAHSADIQIQALLESLGIEYHQDETILSGVRLESVYCKQCQRLVR